MAKLEVLPKRYEFLDANDNACQFRINIDVLNEAFGVGRGMYARACYPDKKDTYFEGENPSDKYFIWMPKLYGNSSEWKNIISEDGSEIYEVAEPTRNEDWYDADNNNSEAMRIVFAKPDNKSPYKFVGVYKEGKMDYCNHTYVRVATKIKLIGNPVSKIELIE